MTQDKNTIYVVYGRTGEYSDRTEWPVRAFRTERAASDFRAQLLETCRHLGVQRGQPTASAFPAYNTEEIETEEEYEHLRIPFRRMMELDPHFRVYYTGTDYSYYSVPLSEEKA